MTDYRNRTIEVVSLPASELMDNAGNWRIHPVAQRETMVGILDHVGIIAPLIAYYSERNGGALTLVDGHLRKDLNPSQQWPVAITDLTDSEADFMLTVYDPVAGLVERDAELLGKLLAGIQEQDESLAELAAQAHGDDLDALLKSLGMLETDATEESRLTLAERFVVPPFSVLDARQGYWQKRKRAWLALGIQSELGRAKMQNSLQTVWEVKTGKYGQDADSWVTSSIFDPVLCELAYRWFCPPGGLVLDPFAGGSVRGIVASRLGRRYVGVDLSETQIAANVVQGESLVPDSMPNWIVGDGLDVAILAPGDYDFVFTCPPYADLEVYSDDPRDLSTMAYIDFLATYRRIIAASVAMLKDDRFACICVGDIRDKKGCYRNFVSDTIAAFLDTGMHLYNEAILVTAAGSLPIRVGRQFEAGRKLGKTHQNVLVFIKGDAKKAVEAIGEIECGDVKAEDDALAL